MKPKNWLGLLGVVAMALLLSPTWASAQVAITQPDGDDTLVIVTDLAEFKTSPNVRAAYSSDATGVGDGTGTTYVAAAVHRAGDRAYGVDPDYTGMFVAQIAVGTTAGDLDMPTPTPGSNSDFTGDWVAK